MSSLLIIAIITVAGMVISTVTLLVSAWCAYREDLSRPVSGRLGSNRLGNDHLGREG